MTPEAPLPERSATVTPPSINRKLFAIAGLTLVLLIPSSYVGALIQERESRRQEAIQEVSGKWGAEQTIGGPVLHVPCRKYVKDEKGVPHPVIELATVLPAELKVDGNVATEVRRRGIYDVVLYRAAVKLSGRFGPVRIDEQEVPPADVLWDRAFVALSITDARGIESRVTLDWDGARMDMQPGTAGSTLAASGIHAHVSLSPASGGGAPTAHRFSLELAVRGHDGLQFLPVAASTSVKLASPWPHPSFAGAFLPVSHHSSAGGFEASWNVLDLNRSFPQQWMGSILPIDGTAFGVNLIEPVDGYQESDRAHKYAILLIAMTFVSLFFVEMLKNERVHGLNYILSGLALCMFYVLLLSLSEHLGFDLAYVIAALATTALITWQTRNILAQRSLCRSIGGMLIVLYGFMYVLLQLKDFALLVGSIGLFALLAAVMSASSRVTASRLPR